MDPELIIVGTGPAGMAAAKVASQHGTRVLILDEQHRPGGQIYRAMEANDPATRPELGESYYEGRPLVDAFRSTKVDYRPGATVWHVAGDGSIGFSLDGKAEIAKADHIILATGAMERPFPVEGWTLAGVKTAGAAQGLLKDAGLGVEEAVFAGTGPLLYLVAYQYLQAGIPVKAVLDMTPPENYWAALRHLPAAMMGSANLLQGYMWKRAIQRSAIPFHAGVRDLRIGGRGSVSFVEYLKGRSWRRIDTRNVLLHQGVVPNVNTSASAGCVMIWNDNQAAWTVSVDEWFQSSQPRISVVGDGATIGGAFSAEQAGYLAAISVMHRLGKIDATQRDAQAGDARRRLKTEMRLRPFLEALFHPAEHLRVPKDNDTVICRCEEISAGQIRALIDRGCRDPNQIKSLTRCGMGPCQARFCGHTLSELIAMATMRPVKEVGYLRIRPPIKPLPLSELATLAEHPNRS